MHMKLCRMRSCDSGDLTRLTSFGVLTSVSRYSEKSQSVMTDSEGCTVHVYFWPLSRYCGTFSNFSRWRVAVLRF